MELRDYARRLVLGATIEDKLEEAPADLSDSQPGECLRIDVPGRPDGLEVSRKTRVKVPPVAGWSDKNQRARIVHALANHELQAIELFAWALLAFSDAPAPFRRGLLKILAEEQSHFRLYCDLLRDLGHDFGDYPVSSHLWWKSVEIADPLEFVCTMGLTFENANLDFAEEYARKAREVGDDAGAAVLDQVHREEVSHVAFAWHWFHKFKPDNQDEWQSFTANVRPPLGPGRARGKIFVRESRQRAGLSDDFIDKLEGATAVRPNGKPR